ncbi:MAG: diguanylate cyclase, partial [Candidatus Dormibacteraceae bacterium]
MTFAELGGGGGTGTTPEGERAAAGDPRLVARVIRERLAERLDLAAEWLQGLAPEPAAQILAGFAELDRHFRVAYPDSTGGGEARPRDDVVARVIKAEVARRLRIAEPALAQLDVRSSAQVLARLNEVSGRLEAERDEGEPPTPHLEAPPPRGKAEPERREMVGRALRDVLSMELSVEPRGLASLSPQLAATTLSRITELKVSPRTAADPVQPPAKERRDIVARIIRDELARRSNLPPRLMGGLDAVAAAAVLDGWNSTARRLRESQAIVATDDLTGCYRRSAGEELVGAEIKRARRLAEGKLTLAFLDVVALKMINDSAGHAAGDSILKQLSEALKSRLRASDLVIRWGGDEFVCALTDAGLDQAAAILKEVQQTCREGPVPFDFSFGLAELGAADTVSTLVERADSDLYAIRRAIGADATGSAADAAAAPSPP